MTFEEKNRLINKEIKKINQEHPQFDSEKLARAKKILYIQQELDQAKIAQLLGEFVRQVEEKEGIENYQPEVIKQSVENAFAEKQISIDATLTDSQIGFDNKNRAETYPTNANAELKSMFENGESSTLGQPVKEHPKQYVKSSSSSSYKKAGFSTVGTLITLTSILSIMGIIISALIIRMN